MIVFVSFCAYGKTVYVDGTNGNDSNDGLSWKTAKATIQACIDAASDGDTVLVADGIYTGDGNRDIDFRGKVITVKSENDAENCIIDCEGTKEEPHRGFYFHSGESDKSIVDGFTIKNGYGPRNQYRDVSESVGGAVYCYNSSPKISNQWC